MGAPFIHPDYLDSTLTHRQWLDWKRFWLVAPWGETRQDLRLEHLRLRLLNAWCEEPCDDLIHEYPYIRLPASLEETKAAQKHAVEGLEQYINNQGKVAHRWKPGYGPQSR